MSSQHNRLKVTANRDNETATLKIERRNAAYLEERMQVTFTIKELEAALRSAEITIPWVAYDAGQA